MLIEILFALIFILTSDLLPWLYLEKANNNDVMETANIASKLLLIVALFQIFDGIQIVAQGALRGIQDVLIPTVLIFIAYILVGLPTSYYLGLNTQLGVVGIWIGLLVGLMSSSIFLLLRFSYDLNFIYAKR